MNNKSQIIEKINAAKNILVTVERSPSVDALTAVLGLTLAVDKLKKHSSAIFSGQIPPIMNFLQPEKTFENSTASFQDFIISLDKEKADKLRYKVEGDLVKIFITPYHTRISPDDLTFEDGEINVDLVLAVGVKKQADLDTALNAHGRILHSAPTITINTQESGQLGTINYTDPKASGYSEIVASLINELDEKLFSKQISTTLLTGIVIETEQFSNQKTTPATMQLASKLLASGADQQLIVNEIRSGGVVSETLPEVMQEIPEQENQVAEPAQAVASADDINLPISPAPENLVSELETLPEVSSTESLLDYMPPPLPDFNAETLPALPSPETAVEPEAAAEPVKTIDLPPPPDNNINLPEVETSSAPSFSDPSQFRIPD
jgi:nanoRNase/pAp phosphatase (c-di-AMP/oligoRNAs hydrolase)